MKLHDMGDGQGFIVWCPGCKDTHRFDGKWSFDGNLETPTFDPSILVECGQLRCHSFLCAGVWQFLDDTTTHELRGMVPMVDLPGYWTP